MHSENTCSHCTESHASARWNAVHFALREHSSPLGAARHSTVGSRTMSVGKQPMKSVVQVPWTPHLRSLTTRHSLCDVQVVSSSWSHPPPQTPHDGGAGTASGASRASGHGPQFGSHCWPPND